MPRTAHSLNEFPPNRGTTSLNGAHVFKGHVRKIAAAVDLRGLPSFVTGGRLSHLSSLPRQRASGNNPLGGEHRPLERLWIMTLASGRFITSAMKLFADCAVMSPSIVFEVLSGERRCKQVSRGFGHSAWNEKGSYELKEACGKQPAFRRGDIVGRHLCTNALRPFADNPRLG
jgi:hypothetical protein